MPGNKKKAAKRGGRASTLLEYIRKSIVETRYRPPPPRDTAVERQNCPVSREAGLAARVEDDERAERWDEA